MKRRMLLRNSAVLALLTAAVGAVHAQAAAPVTAKADYVLGAGDVVKVTVYQSPELGAEARVTESGFVSLPLIGQVKIGGLTISEAEKTIASALLIPVARCPEGVHLDRIFRLCILGTTRLAAVDQTWLKWLVAAAGVAGGGAMIWMHRWLTGRTVLAVAFWVFGIGWLLRDTMWRGL